MFLLLLHASKLDKVDPFRQLKRLLRSTKQVSSQEEWVRLRLVELAG